MATCRCEHGVASERGHISYVPPFGKVQREFSYRLRPVFLTLNESAPIAMQSLLQGGRSFK